MNLFKALKVDCNLTALDIQKKISFIFEVILSIVENEDCQKEIDKRQNLVSVGSENEDMP